MRRSLIAAAVAGIVATTTVVPGADARPRLEAAPDVGGRGLSAQAPPSLVTVRGGGGQADAGIGDALPEFDRATPQRAGRSRAGRPSDLDPARTASPGTIDIGQRAALREAGWTVPAKLAGQWSLRDARVLAEADDGGGTLQLVYTRGRQRVSVFQRADPVNWSAVPDHGSSVPELAGSVREWPDAQPARLVWQTEDRTFVVVGEVERDELMRIARSLPDAEAESVWRRLRRGVGELLARLAP